MFHLGGSVKKRFISGGGDANGHSKIKWRRLTLPQTTYFVVVVFFGILSDSNNELAISDKVFLFLKVPGNFCKAVMNTVLFLLYYFCCALTARAAPVAPSELAGSFTASHSNVMCLDYLSQPITGKSTPIWSRAVVPNI